jgi:hypothetical protein
MVECDFPQEPSRLLQILRVGLYFGFVELYFGLWRANTEPTAASPPMSNEAAYCKNNFEGQ